MRLALLFFLLPILAAAQADDAPTLNWADSLKFKYRYYNLPGMPYKSPLPLEQDSLDLSRYLGPCFCPLYLMPDSVRQNFPRENTR